MIKLLQYLIPVLAITLMSLFFMLLPDLRQKHEIKGDGAGGRRDTLACLAVTFAYALAAFTNLGTLNTPQTFSQLSTGKCVTAELEGGKRPDRLLVYSGINVGSCAVELSCDGFVWTSVATVDQNYAELLRWHEYDIGEYPKGDIKYIRICGNGGTPRIGELALLSGDELLTLRPSDDLASVMLTDEQDTVPEDVTYLNSSYFDEIYHARTADEHIEKIEPYEISHPPLGKLIIALGIKLFGLNPFGWRFMGTLAGVLMIPLMYAFLRDLFGNLTVSVCGSLLLASDFMHFTQTRIATIDSFSVLLILLMYWLMFRYLRGDGEKWLALSGVAFGLGAAVKWICLYAGLGLGVLWLAHWVAEYARLLRRVPESACNEVSDVNAPAESGEEDGVPAQPDTESGHSDGACCEKRELFMAFLKNCGLCLLFFVLVPSLIYYASYFPYGTARGMSLPGLFFKKEYLNIVLENQQFMFSYHSGITATHPYSSKWYQWLFDIRPILYYLKYYADGTRSSFGAFLNPVLCWGGLVSIIMLTFISIRHRDRTAAFIVFSWLAQLLPWVFVSRILFEYHYFACSVFLVPATAYLFAVMLKNKNGKYCVIGYTALSVLLFILFYPAVSGMRVDSETYTMLVSWLPTWPF